MGTAGRGHWPPELVDDPRFLTNPDRVRNRAELEAIVGRFFAERTVAENLSHFEERGVTVGPICDIRDLMDHPVIQGREIIETYGDPDFGELPMHAPYSTPVGNAGRRACACSGTGRAYRRHPLDLGLSSDRIAALREDGVI